MANLVETIRNASLSLDKASVEISQAIYRLHDEIEPEHQIALREARDKCDEICVELRHKVRKLSEKAK